MYHPNNFMYRNTKVYLISWIFDIEMLSQPQRILNLILQTYLFRTFQMKVQDILGVGAGKAKRYGKEF